MQDTNAQPAIRIDIRVPKCSIEAEIGRRVGVVAGELHGGFEVAAVVGGVRVEDDEGDAPFEDVFVDEGDVGPGFFGEFFELFHEDLVCHDCGSGCGSGVG